MRKLIVVTTVAVSLLLECDQESTGRRETLSETLVAKSLPNMAPVRGGEFLMGDFGPLVGEKLPFSINQDNKVLYKVVLSDFSISKSKVTNDDYNKYLQVTGIKKPPTNILLKEYPSLQKGDYFVGVAWQQAKGYCQWLGKESGRNIDLSTEAQQGYAARSGGQYLPFTTNNGNFELGFNIPKQKKLDEYADGYGFPIYPIEKYPPNPLGLYNMGLSGTKWSNDWYSTDYYSRSPIYDPQGPVKSNEKVLRGYVGGDRQYALTISRQSSQPVPEFAGRGDYQKFGVSPLSVFRYVINK